MSEITDRFEISLPAGWQKELPSSTLISDQEKMAFVLRLAMWNIENKTGGPFAAAVFVRESNEIVSIGVNRVVPQNCSLAHAEAIAIALAQQQQQTFDLSKASGPGFELFASGQPCVQCFGMTWWSGVTRLVIGARATDIEDLTDFREGPLPTEWQSRLASRSPQPAVTVVQDVCREEACAVLKHYADNDGLNYSPGI